MSKHWKSIVAGIVGIVALAVVLTAATTGSDRQAHPSGAATEADAGMGVAAPASGRPSQADDQDRRLGAVQRVEPHTVCMVNDRAMGKPQIAVEVDRKTYYGCCEMCKQRLAQEEAVRYAIDPVTGARVDKASAVIAERPDGSVLYFESAETFDRFGKQDEPR